MKALIEPNDAKLSIRNQCQLLGINRSSWYYQPRGIDAYTVTLMHRIDEQYTKTPFYGVPRMTRYLRSQGYWVNPKRVARLYQQMGLEAVYPKQNLSQPHPEHEVYPYLLRHMAITHPDQVWSTDVTYIRLAQGFVYLMAIMDWFSRYVVDWQLSITLEADFCIEGLQRALRDNQCEIFNSDQGSQFTTPRFTQILKDANIRISMDGRGRALDNIFVERLWRSVKHECIYLRDLKNVPETRAVLKDYFAFYNHERFHQSLDYKTPAQVYLGH